LHEELLFHQIHLYASFKVGYKIVKCTKKHSTGERSVLPAAADIVHIDTDVVNHMPKNSVNSDCRQNCWTGVPVFRQSFI